MLGILENADRFQAFWRMPGLSGNLEIYLYSLHQSFSRVSAIMPIFVVND